MKKSWSGAGVMQHALNKFKAKARRGIRLQRRAEIKRVFTKK